MTYEYRNRYAHRPRGRWQNVCCLWRDNHFHWSMECLCNGIVPHWGDPIVLSPSSAAAAPFVQCSCFMFIHIYTTYIFRGGGSNCLQLAQVFVCNVCDEFMQQGECVCVHVFRYKWSVLLFIINLTRMLGYWTAQRGNKCIVESVLQIEEYNIMKTMATKTKRNSRRRKNDMTRERERAREKCHRRNIKVINHHFHELFILFVSWHVCCLCVKHLPTTLPLMNGCEEEGISTYINTYRIGTPSDVSAIHAHTLQYQWS